MVFSKLITMENLIPKFRLMYLSVVPDYLTPSLLMKRIKVEAI